MNQIDTVLWVNHNDDNRPVVYAEGALRLAITAPVLTMTIDQRLAVEELVKFAFLTGEDIPR